MRSYLLRAVACAVTVALGFSAPPRASAQLVSRTITHLKQDDPRAFDPETGNPNMNCTPTAMIMCLDYWARNGYAGLVSNANLNNLYSEVRAIAVQGNCFKKGMSWRSTEEALKKWLEKHHTQNPLKVTPHEKDRSRDDIFNEFSPAGNAVGQDVIWLGFLIDGDFEAQWPGHTMTLEWINKSDEKAVPGEGNSGRSVGFADPATGAKHEFTMSKSGDLYENGKRVYKGGGFFTVCPGA